MSLRVVIIQSEMASVQPLARYFTQRNDEVWQAWELGQAWALMSQVKPNLVMMDLHFASSDWIQFIRRMRQTFPEARIIMTSKYPDLQREMLVRDQGIQIFLRQPFSARWIEQALKRLAEDTQPVRVRRRSAADAVGTSPVNDAAQLEKKVGLPSLTQTVRVPVRVKLTLPYLVLVLMFSLASAYLVSRMLLETSQDRFVNQLIETSKQSGDAMVREESRLLETERLLANTDGMADAIQRRDAEKLRALALPAVVNAAEDAVEILDPSGVSVLSIRRANGASTYDFTRDDTTFQQWDFVTRVAKRQVDPRGDKYSGVARSPWGTHFYVSGPILGADGSLQGIMLVGKSLYNLTRQIQQETLSEITCYDRSGAPYASTFSPAVDAAASLAVADDQVNRTLDAQTHTAVTRDLTISTIGYSEILAPWQTRDGETQGLLGVSLAQAFLVRTSRVTQVEIFGLVAFGILLVILVGLFLANRITGPLLHLVSASIEVAQGNLGVKIDANGNDEVAVLAQSFNYMIAGLQEGSIYRDLLGRTVSPEVREQLRQTFTSGNLRLEGQQAVATVLMSDIRGFTTISEKADPATVFQWLNEYFAQLVPIVTAHGGVVNKFDGDAMLAFFGILPRLLSPKQSALAACQAAVEIQAAIDTINRQRRKRGEPVLITGIGVNTGVIIAGGLGTSDRLHYTIIGDTVNTTQRLESLTRDLLDCTGTLISQSTYSALGGAGAPFALQTMGEHVVKGREEPVLVFHLTGSLPASGETGRGTA